MFGKNTALKAGFGYTLGNILVKGINFLTLPLFSRLLTTAEFGVYNVFLSYDAILSVLVGFAMATSVKSAHYEFKKTDEYVSSISLIYILNSIFYFTIIFVIGQRLSSWMGFSKFVLLLLVFFSFGGAIIQLYNERISLDYEYKKYLIVALLNSVGNVIVSLLLMVSVFRNKRDIGRIVGTAATIFTIAVVILIRMYIKAPPRFDEKFWRFGLLYSLPIVPHGISQVLLAQCDRIMISRMVNESAAGIYSLAGNLKLVLTVVSTSIGVSWSTWFFSKMDKEETVDIQKKASLLVLIFLIFTVGLMALSPEIIYVLGGKEYELGKYVAIPMIMDAFILFLYNIIVPSEYYTKKTHFIMMGTLIAAVVNVITNYIFIILYGFVGAAYTTLFSYVCYLVLHIVISKRLVKFEVIRSKWIIITTSVAALTGVLDLLFVENIIFRYGLCVIVVVALCFLTSWEYGISNTTG
ncbi:oligosaccharide flippase family protein [Butyrivibrio sp. VCD2006]|uniref:oligosaccharide flippase family protein n=1 Tax=Butyrivibrio sp. VCD2006 TaxID=1280664 RepID=UPI000424FF5C|nr:oligosaccharide flippase family protein [Butyrivibrio sp. VCD2006]